MTMPLRLDPSDPLGEATSVDEPPIDGRTARAVRTRQAIVDACIELVEGGDPRPTGPRIATRAGVSVRSVFQHFDDLETLFAAVGRRVVDRVSRLIVPVDPGLPLDDRIASLVAQRARLLEAVTPIRRAASAHSVGSAEINRRFQSGHDFLRQQVMTVFAPELEQAGDLARVVLDSLDVALSWSTWETLRVLNGRSDQEARQVQEWMVRAALTAALTAGLSAGPTAGPR